VTCDTWKQRRTQRRRPGARGVRPALEQLEDRLTPTTLPPGFIETNVVSGLSGPTAMEFAPDGRLFVLEQSGNVKLVHGDGTTSTALHLNVDSVGERGLLGIAFDPAFATNHFAYLYYTNPNPGAAPWATGEHNQLSRFTVNDADPQHPTFTNEAPILDWNNLGSATNHNGGAIHFGLDGKLYANAGDNAQTFTLNGNTYRVSQTLANLLGKQLRIDVAQFNNGTATRDDTTVGHLIPADNPFVGTASGINQLIYVLGLRNPFTFAVQPGTGTIYINDVGEVTWEEIDRAVAGGNYGWSGGATDGFGQSPPGPGTYRDPLLAYNHSGGPAGGGAAIVGGTFYNPATAQFPAGYYGKYFYADLGAGWIRVFDPAHPGSRSNPDTSTAFATGTPGSLRDLKVDAAGNLYYLSGNGGKINKISFPAGAPPGQTPGGPFQVRINFQPAGAPVPAGYLADTGAVFGDRGNGFQYGWNADNSRTARIRRRAARGLRFNTLQRMQAPVNPHAVWEIAVPNGTYRVRIVAGDPNFINSVYKIKAEGALVINGTPTADHRWFDHTVRVRVTDGRLTVRNARGARNNKIDFLEITAIS
jgi:glucose/arabinose dehydrogenase